MHIGHQHHMSCQQDKKVQRCAVNQVQVNQVNQGGLIRVIRIRVNQVNQVIR